MPVYEVEISGQTFEVDAQDEAGLNTAISQLQAQAQGPPGGQSGPTSPFMGQFVGPTEEQATPPPPPSQGQIDNRVLNALPGIGGREAGAELMLQGLTGLASQTLAGFGGMVGMGGGMPLERQVDAINRTQEALTYQPKTQGAQAVEQKLGETLGPLVQKGQDFLWQASGENPAIATGIQTVLEGAAAIFGLNKQRLTRRQVKAAERTLEKAASDLGINIENPDLMGELSKAGSRLSGDARGSELVGLQLTLRQARARSREIYKKQFEVAQGHDVHLYARTLDELVTGINDRLKPLTEASNDPAITRRIAQIRQLFDDNEVREKASTRKWSEQNPMTGERIDHEEAVNPRYVAPITYQLNALDEIKRHIPTKGPEGDRNWTSAERERQAAFKVMREEIDTYIERQFDTAMFSGDPRAQAAWKNADKFFAQHRERFNQNRFIRKLINNEATPEMLRNYIFGASKTGVRVDAGLTIRRLNEILGPDSPQMGAIRKEFLFDVMQPLFQREPDFGAFLNRFDKLNTDYPGFIKELNPLGNAATNQLYQFVKTARDIKLAPEMRLELDKLISRSLFGHEIAKAGVRVQLGTSLISLLRRSQGKTQWEQVRNEIIGEARKTPLITAGSAAETAFIGYVINEAGEEAGFEDENVN